MGAKNRKQIERNQRLVSRLKEENCCIDCEHFFPACAMDFDHVQGDKVAGVSKLVATGCSLEKLERELDKCELVCACCHRIRTYKRLNDISW